MDTALKVGVAHQKIIRDRKASMCDPVVQGSLFGDSIPTDVDIKKCVIREVSYETAEKIILEYEWLGTMGTTQYHYGIYFGNNIGGVVCYGYFQAMQGYDAIVGEKYGGKGIQLTRGACVHWAHPHSASKLISESLRMIGNIGYKYVIAFSDPEAGEIGTVYQATNWHYIGFGVTPHYDIYYRNGKLFMNDRDLAKKYGFRGKNKLEEFIKDKPYLVIKERYPKGRYVYLLGTRKDRAEMMSYLKRHIKPYPKRSGL